MTEQNGAAPHLFRIIGNLLVLREEATANQLRTMLPDAQHALLPTIIVSGKGVFGKGGEHHRKDVIRALVRANATLVLATDLYTPMARTLKLDGIAFTQISPRTCGILSEIPTMGDPITLVIFEHEMSLCTHTHQPLTRTILQATRREDALTHLSTRTWLDMRRREDILTAEGQRLTPVTPTTPPMAAL